MNELAFIIKGSVDCAKGQDTLEAYDISLIVEGNY